MSDEVVRRLSLTFSENGADATTGKVNKLSDASNNLATVTDTNAKRALSADAAWQKLNGTLDPVAANQAAIEKGTRTLNAALAEGIITQDKYTQSLAALKEKYSDVDAANDNVKEGFNKTGIEAASVANHIRQAAEAAYVLSPAFRALVNPAIAGGLGLMGTALAAMGPAAGVVATAITSRLLPALSLALRVAGPILLIVDAIKLVGYAWQSAGDQIAKYNTLATQGKGTGVDSDFFQRMAKSGDDAKISIDAVTDSLKKFKSISDDKLGGSDLQKKIDAHIDAGNLDSNTGVDSYSNANGAEAKYRAIVDLLKQMTDEGKKLAALDIAATFASPEQLELFRKYPGYFQEVLDKADAISSTKLVKQQDIDDAVALKNRYDDAVKILSERWIPFQDTITAGGMVLQRTWVSIVESIAAAATGIYNIATAIGNLKPPAWLGAIGSAMLGAVGNLLTPTPIQGAVAAVNYLGAKPSGSYPEEYQPTGKYTGNTAPDKSNELEKEAKAQTEYNDAVDRAINLLQKHVLTQQADASAVGLGAGALAGFRAEAVETAAKLANNGVETADQAAKFALLKVAAIDAADALAKAQIASEINRGRQLAFASPEDVQIANQLKGIYGDDIPAALNSAEAAALRMNRALKVVKPTNQREKPVEFNTCLKAA